MPSILNYTTKVSADVTAGQVTTVLAKAGVKSIATEYSNGRPSGIGFTLATPHGDRSFSLPVNIEGVRLVLVSDKVEPRYRTKEQAERVAWRVAKAWIEAQVALVRAGAATIDEVMLPYLMVDAERTMYTAYKENEQRALGK